MVDNYFLIWYNISVVEGKTLTKDLSGQKEETMHLIIKENVDYTLVKNDVKSGSDFEVLVNGFEKGEYLYSTKFQTLGDAERNFNTLSAMEVR